MTGKELWGAAASLITVASYVPYAWSTVRGRTRPHTFSWAIWALATGIAVAAQLVKGSGAGVWPAALSAFFCGLVAVVGAIRGDFSATKLDRGMFATALAAIGLWYLTNSASLALALMMLIDTLAFAMTIRKTWTRPHDEMAFCYGLYAVAMVFALLAVQVRTVMTILYPAFILAANAATALLIVARRRAVTR